MSTLREEIKQRKPFVSMEAEACLNVLRTNEALQRGFRDLFRDHGLTPPQYNVLRILRGSADGLPSLEIAGRVVTRAPDITRLVDRLEAAGLVQRERSLKDRRVVQITITEAGLDVLSDIDAPLATQQRRAIGHLTPNELTSLIGLMEKARSGRPDPADD